MGAATFTSTQGDQVVQGFNFLIPVETVREAAAKAGVIPTGQSEFSRLWNHGVDLYIRDLHYRAFRNMSAAAAIHPGFPDVERVREDCQIKHNEQGYLHREEVQWVLVGLGLVGGDGGPVARRATIGSRTAGKPPADDPGGTAGGQHAQTLSIGDGGLSEREPGASALRLRTTRPGRRGDQSRGRRTSPSGPRV